VCILEEILLRIILYVFFGAKNGNRNLAGPIFKDKRGENGTQPFILDVFLRWQISSVFLHIFANKRSIKGR